MSGDGTPNDKPKFLADPDERPGPPPLLQEAPKQGARGLTVLIALLALAIFSGLVWYAYDQGLRAGSEAAAPLIKADTAPAKVRPDQPGGMAIPHQDKTVYDAIKPEGEKTATVERLLPPPETPLPPPTPAPAPKAESPIPPAKVEVKPETETASAAPLPPATTPEPKSSTAVEAPKKPVPAPQPAKPKPVVKVEPKPKPAPAPKPAAGKFKIQIAAVRSEAAARAEWTRVQKRNQDLLGGLTMKTQQVDLGGSKGIFHRIQAGSVSEAAARDICAKLKSRKQACIVVKP